MSDSDTQCPQCGEPVPPPVGSAAAPTHCGRCGAELPATSPPPRLNIESWFAEPEPAKSTPPPPIPEPPAEALDLQILDETAATPPAEVAAEPLPDSALHEDVPLVQPMRAAPKPPISQFRPRGLEDEPERPRPQIGLAIVALLLMFLILVVGLTVILYAFWIGFKSLPRPRKAEAPVMRLEYQIITASPAARRPA